MAINNHTYGTPSLSLGHPIVDKHRAEILKRETGACVDLIKLPLPSQVPTINNQADASDVIVPGDYEWVVWRFVH